MKLVCGFDYLIIGFCMTGLFSELEILDVSENKIRERKIKLRNRVVTDDENSQKNHHVISKLNEFVLGGKIEGIFTQKSKIHSLIFQSCEMGKHSLQSFENVLN
jgi:hypothetical protein